MLRVREALRHPWFTDPLVIGSVVFVSLVALCSVIVHVEEGWGAIDSVYFSVMSVTTLGDPNFAPSHDVTKVFLIFYLPVGIGVGLTVLAAFGARVLDTQRRRLERLANHRALQEAGGEAHGKEQKPPPT